MDLITLAWILGAFGIGMMLCGIFLTREAKRMMDRYRAAREEENSNT